MSDMWVDLLLGLAVGIGIGIVASAFGTWAMAVVVGLQVVALGYAIVLWRSGVI